MIAVLHNIRSVYNVASCFRTADGAGVEKIYLTGHSPAPVDRFGRKIERFSKVSLGAEQSMPWEHVEDIAKLITKLKKEGCEIIAVEQGENSTELSDVDSQQKKICLIFGNETKGLDKQVLQKSDKVVELPMRGKKESLNISVTFGIVVYYYLLA